MKKMNWRILVIALTALAVIAGGVIAGAVLMGENTVPGKPYTYESSLRWYETVDEVVLDAKKDDALWHNIRPFQKTTNKINRAEKYEAMESRITECNVEVYTGFGEKGLFLYAKTDDPVVNTSVVSPLSKSAFEFYICSQDKLTKWGNIFEFTISADNCLKLRVRDHHPDTGAEAWVNVPCAGVKSYTALEEAGYAVECFIPWSTLNIAAKPEKLQLATALIRVLDPEDATNFLWECFDYYTAPIALNNSATFPLFDQGGYIAVTDGDNFKAVNTNIIDLSTDTGDAPYVTTLNRSTVTSFLNMDAAADVYWQSTVTIRDFNPNDDPRVGIVLKGEEREDGSYDRVYLMLELEKSYEGEGYQLKHALMLPSSDQGNNWKDAQRYVLASHIDDDSFKLAMMKRNGVFYFFIDDVLVASRSAVEDFAADTKVTCGITSWYTGAVFSDYMATTENLDAVLSQKRSTFVTDEKKWKLYFDLFHQNEGYVTTNESDAWMYHSIANFQGIEASRFYAQTDIAIHGSLVNGNAYAGFVLTCGENRLYIMLAGTQKGLQYVEYHSMTKDIFTPTGAGHKVCEAWDTVKLGNKNKLAIYRDGKDLTVLLNGQVLEQLDLSALTYPIQGNTKIGLTGWKVNATFSGYSVKTGNGFTAPEFCTASSGVTHGDFTMELTKESTLDVFAQTNLKISDTMAGVFPRVGLRLTNEKGTNLDFFVYYNQEQQAQSWVMARLTDAEGKDLGQAQYYSIDSAVGALSDQGIRLAVAKKDGMLYFYANDVLLGTKAYEGFGAGDKVTASLYSKFTKTDFYDYLVSTAPADAMAQMHSCFIADDHRSSDCFDVLHYADAAKPQITINESCAYKDSSILHWNSVSSDKIFAKTSVELNNEDNAYAGMVLSDAKGNRFYVMTYGNAKGITYMEYVSVAADDFETRTSVYDKISVAGGNRCSVSIDKNGSNLLVYVDDTLVKTLTLPDSLAGETKVGLAAWKGASAVYTNYSVLAGEDYPEVQEPEFIPDASHMDNGNHVFCLNETPYENLKAYTTISVTDVRKGVSPRVGLRLTSTAGKNLDVVIAYKNTQELWKDWLQIVPSTESAEGQYVWVELPEGTLPSGDAFTLQAEKVGDILSLYVDGVLVYSDKYEGFGADQGVTAALYSRYTQSAFTQYATEELSAPVSEDSALDNSCHVYALNETAATDLYAQTSIKVTDVSSGVSPRVGLRLTNEMGSHVDFFVYYNTSKAAQNWVIAVPVNAGNTDAGTKQYYGIDSAVSKLSEEGITLAVAKKGDKLYFYVNDVLLGAKAYPGFGAEDAVIASLYSKYTQTDFSQYSFTTDVDAAMDAKQADFIADDNRTSDCFDVLGYADAQKPQIAINETCSNAASSIIHWNGICSQRIYAETNIALHNTSNAYAGIVLSDKENNRFYVMAYGNANGITYMEYFTVIGDDYSERTSIYDSICVSGGNQCKLAVYKEGGDLLVYVDDVPVKTLTLPAALAGETKVGLSAWKSAKAVFTDYQVADTYVTDVKKGTDLYTLGKESGDFYAQTLLRINAPTTGVYSRVGLRLAAGDKTWDCVVYFSNKGGLEPYILLVDQKESKQYSEDYSSLLPGKQMPLTLRLGVKREGQKLSVYLNGILLKDYYVPDSTAFTCFSAEDAITVSLYAKLTDAVFTDYSVQPLS